MGFTVLCVMVEREIPSLLQNMLWYGLHAASEGETPSFRESLSTRHWKQLGEESGQLREEAEGVGVGED